MQIITDHEEVVLGDRFHYATMSLSIVEPMLRVPREKDSYLSEDADSRALRDLLQKGYRWIRTDEGICVFEKVIGICCPKDPKVRK